MCTVTVVTRSCPDVGPIAADAPHRRGVRIACNRDELRTRPSALAPQVRMFGAHHAIMPVDPVSDGTWIAVNEVGLAATLLNVYAAPASGVREPGRFKSRGIIVPRLMMCESAGSAARTAHEFDVRDFPPFRLVIVDERDVFDLYSDGSRLSCAEQHHISGPAMFTSSGLGDDVVEPPRRALFEELFIHPANLQVARQSASARQDAFHRNRWSDRPEISVCMSRTEAHTVSYTVVDINPNDVALTYYPEAPDQDSTPISVRIGRRRAARTV